MGDEIRNSGIDVVGRVPWGTHFCQFYKTKQDLIDILVPYFKAGLEDAEFCMWITSEPLLVDEAQRAMRRAVEDFDEYLRRGQIEIIPYSEWYLLGGTFDDDGVLKGWVTKLEKALARGYAGLRLTGNTFWLERNHWQAFTEYEAKVNDVIGRYRMIAACTYNLDRCDGTAVIDVVKNHQFALVKQEGKWDIIESTIYKQAEAQIEALSRFPRENPNPILRLNRDGAIIYANASSRPLLEYWHCQEGARLPQPYRKLVTKALRSGRQQDCEVDCTGRIFSLTFAPVIEMAYVNIYGINITNRKHAEEALRKSEQDLNRAQAVAHAGSWRLDVQNDQLLWSDETYRIFGIPGGTPMTYETFLICVYPDDREYVDRKWAAALQGEPYDIEHRIIVGDEVKWVRERAELELDLEGEFKGGFGTVQDITGLKRLEDELRVKDYAVASTINGIAIADLNGYVTYLNPACLSMWNYEEEEVLGKHATTFFTDKNEADAALKAVLEEGAWQGEIKARRRDGSVFDVQVLANLVTNADGEPFCSMVSFVDITEIIKIQETLAREKDILQTIMENTGAMLVYFDRDFNFIRVNSAYAENSGHAEEDLIGKNHFALFPSEENQAIFERVRDTGEPVVYHDKPFEFEDQPERGVTYWDWTLTPVKDSLGMVQGLVLSLIDTTARKKVEDLKDAFIGMVSHELRTPLTVVNGCLSTVLSEWDRLPSSEAQQLLRDAVLESEALSHLVENLLELSRFQAQQLALYAEPTDVKALVRETITKVKRQALSYQFITSIPDGLQLINADPLRIERILYNLLENAAKYSPPGSQIKVSATLEPERLVIGVHNKGRGLSLSEQAKLFTPFWRLEEARPDKARGAGLGLVVCRVLVEAHGGEIWVDSKIGKGPTFFFSLPYKEGTDANKISPGATK